MQETAVMVATPAQDPRMHTGPERRHTLAQVEMPPEGTLAVVHSLMSRTVRGRFILVSPRGGIMAQLVPVRENTLQVNRSITITMALSTPGLVRFPWISYCPSELGHSKQETAEMVVMRSLGTPTHMAVERLRILALVATHPGGRWTVDGTTKLGSGVYNPFIEAESNTDRRLLDGGEERKSGAEAHTGAGGNASGGSVEGEGGLINLFSGTHRALGPPVMLDSHMSRKWR